MRTLVRNRSKAEVHEGLARMPCVNEKSLRAHSTNPGSEMSQGFLLNYSDYQWDENPGSKPEQSGGSRGVSAHALCE